MKKTKVIATIGPACDSLHMIEEFIKSGVNVFRLNFSHGSHEDHQKYFDLIKGARRKLRTHTAILADLQGPKIRVGIIDKVLIEKEDVVLSCDKPNEGEIPVQYQELFKDVGENDRLLLDDGKIELRVIKTAGKKIIAKVVVGGKLSSNKGINLPTGTITADVITSKDIEDARFALKNGVDFLALSFVESAKNIDDLRKVIKASNNKTAQIIAKIERHEALRCLDEIICATDAVMVARGDLGIEVPSQEVPIEQKRIIRRCLSIGRPVIVATQMLESMIESPRSTRAETSDIANAILDGADAVMLSGETSVGKYPLNAVRAMKAIALNTEEWMVKDKVQIGRRIERDLSEISEAIPLAAHQISIEIKSKYIVAATLTGNNARAVSKYRPHSQIIAVTQSDQVAGQLSLCWGVMPLVMKFAHNRDLTNKVIDYLKDNKLAKKGERITIVSGITRNKVGGTNLVIAHEID